MRQTAIVANGCFWCTEAIFQKLRGVESVESGYIGGMVVNPSYEEVSSGKTGHAEAIRIIFDDEVLPYRILLDVFWYTHDPTTLNRQGNDVGTQYRSTVFYVNDDQRVVAEELRDELHQSGTYTQPIVTQIVPAGEFYKAEGYHQNFYNQNQDYPYCQLIIAPKLKKLLEKYKSKVVE